MLKNDFNHSIDLAVEKERVIGLMPEVFHPYISNNDEIIHIEYPVWEYPSKVTSTSFDKEKEISAKLIGIRAQYLMFENGVVLNIRKHSGYEIELNA